ncbi:MAG: amidohydrolase, partial [Anaerolineae bacterium]|nr:amidohydrolase [Anaerolineae bacterium]
MLVTDCHAHIYSPDTDRYPQIERPYLPPSGTGTLEHLKREMATHDVARVVVIHTSTAYEWDNRLLADTARAHAPWMVGVCTLNPEDPASPALLQRYVQAYNVRGMRSVPAGPDRSRLDHPGVDALWSVAEELGITINPLIHVNLADQLEAMLRRHPQLNVVLDHCMYPRGRDGLQGETIQRVLRLADYPNLHAKLTWLVDSSDEEDPFEDTYPLLRAVIDAYGPERCLWGSDFPCELWIPKAS